VNTATAQTHTSLAQRLAKVRNCMLVELSTGISPTDKDLFISLCEAYEQNNVETSSPLDDVHQVSPYRVLALRHLMPENTEQQWLEYILAKIHSQWQLNFDFADDNGFSDWTKGEFLV